MPYFAPHHLDTEPSGHTTTPPPTPIVFERVEAHPAPWAYRVVTLDPREEAPLDEPQLQELGAEGWLLAGILAYPTSQAPQRLMYYFVRPAA